ncbi:hypothetical protein BAE44_0005931 [Dichanthelium oligosanthes]|uniref:Uncharacterized protein n=1 Tax=Dichanthelium oligosanthes TaxID=888268 RepID=A0A1E5W752_9POAL|nr:hypothetical protein BAE44_0005931 [Dichanthelium oligosanthes]
MGLRLYGDCSAFLDELRLSAGVGPAAGPQPAFSLSTAILAGELDLDDAHLFPDAAAGNDARPFSLAGTDTIFPGCWCCLARSPPTEPAIATEAAAAPSVRRPGDWLALRLPLPVQSPLLLSRLPDRFLCGEPRCGDGLDTAACLSRSSSAILAVLELAPRPARRRPHRLPRSTSPRRPALAPQDGMVRPV